MIWDTSIWRLGCLNRSKIHSAQKCYPCLRYVVSPMSPGWTLKRLVGLGGLEPPTSPLSGARSSHLSYRPQHRSGTVHNYLIVRWFSVFRNCAETALRYKTATSPIHSLC